MATVYQLAGRYSQTLGHHAPGSPEVVQAEHALREAKLAGYIARIVQQAPPLPEEARRRLAAILATPADTETSRAA